MDEYLVLTIIGDDHPGLVEEVAETVASHGGNWLESRMSHLAGKFAGIARVQAPGKAAGALVAALEGLDSRGLRLIVERGSAEGAAAGFVSVVLDLVGTDQPGIVRDISRALHRRGVNIEDLNTDRGKAAMTGEPLFRATARLHLPPDVPVDDLRKDLEKVARSLMVDLRLDEPAE